MFGYRLTMQSLMRRRGDRFDWRWTTPGWVMQRGSRSGWSRSGMMEESRVKGQGHSGMMGSRVKGQGKWRMVAAMMAADTWPKVGQVRLTPGLQLAPW